MQCGIIRTLSVLYSPIAVHQKVNTFIVSIQPAKHLILEKTPSLQITEKIVLEE